MYTRCLELPLARPQVTRSGDCMSVCTDELEEAVADVQAAIAR